MVRGVGRSPLARIALTPADDDLLLVTSSTEGVYRSTDGGDSWATANEGISSMAMREVAISPTNPDLAFAGGSQGGLFRTDDGAARWAEVEGFGRVTALAFPDDGSGRVVVADAAGRISTSDDDGQTWAHDTPAPGAGVTDIAVGATEATQDTVVATLQDGRTMRSEDGADTWEVLDEQVGESQPQGVALSTTDADTLWVSTADEGAYRSQDSGTSWEAQTDRLTKSEQADEVEVPHFRTIRAAAHDDGELLLLAGFDGLFRSTDGGDTWDPVETAADYIAGLDVSPAFADDGTLAAMTYVKGGFISRDGGDSWEPMNGGLHFEGLSEGNRLLPLRRGHNIVFSPAYAEDGTIFAATWPQVIKSEDRGETWEAIYVEEPTEGWSPLRQYVLAVSPAYAEDQTVFAGNRHGQVFRSEGGGEAGTWTEVAPVDGRVRTFAISPGYTDDQTLYVSSVGGVFKSTDAGDSWQATGPGKSPVASGGELDPAPLLAMSPTYPSDGTVFAGTDQGLHVTRDGGQSWAAIDAAPITPDDEIAAVSVSPSFGEDGTMLVSVGGDGLYRSSDGGRTFTAVAAELADANLVITDYDNPTSSPIQFTETFDEDHTVFAYAGPSVLRSTDAGATWQVLELPSVDVVATSLEVEVDALNRAGGALAAESSPGATSSRRALVLVLLGVTAVVVIALARWGRRSRRATPDAAG